MIRECLAYLGTTPVSMTTVGEEQVWGIVHDSAAVYLAINARANELTIESPVVNVPASDRVAMMREVLTLNLWETGVARFCVRDNVVMLRYTNQIEKLMPPQLVGAITRVAVVADDWDDYFALSFNCSRIGPRAKQKRLTPDFRGLPRSLPMLRARIEGQLRDLAGKAQRDRPQSTTHSERHTSSSPPVGRHLTPVAGKHRQVNAASVEASAQQAEADVAFFECVRRAALSLSSMAHSEFDTFTQVYVYRCAAFFFHCRFGQQFGTYTATFFDGANPIALAAPPQHKRSFVGSSDEVEDGYSHFLVLPAKLAGLARGGFDARRSDKPVSIPRFRQMSDGVAFLSGVRSFIEDAPTGNYLRYYVYLGAICEFLMRTGLKGQLADEIRIIVAEKSKADFNDGGWFRLQQVVEHLIK